MERRNGYFPWYSETVGIAVGDGDGVGVSAVGIGETVNGIPFWALGKACPGTAEDAGGTSVEVRDWS